ncbi:hypothetical protein D3OALGB2SA_4301 [Olavius algarvensis associated proteobacterium Delta 3]|nr:hypothetical protein D3OALGB2SA_4301 [Olavius algarvensis associated proteobacterium Delta 3]
MRQPIAMIPYTNMAPYRALGAPDGCCFVSCVPAQSVHAIKAGEVTTAAVPVGAMDYVAGEVEPLGPFGIGARERSMSVLFFSNRPFYEMGATSRIRVTEESASSVRLLFMLLESRNGPDHLPHIAGPRDSIDGELLIGDTALKKVNQLRDPHGYPYITDLASEWYRSRGLPIVFARWVVRKDAPSIIRSALDRWLGEFKKREHELVEHAVPPSAAQLGVPEHYIREYFRVIRRVLDKTDLAGQAAFFSELERFQKRCRLGLTSN